MHTKTRIVLSQYRKASEYSDEVGKRYHFPRKYFNQMVNPDTEFVYYEPQRKGEGVYFGYGEIGPIQADPENAGHFFADLINYRPFRQPVSGSTGQGKTRETAPFYNAQNAVRQINGEVFEDICREGGIELASLGTDNENSDSGEGITEPFDPSKIKVDREPMPIFQVLRKISLGEIRLDPEFQRNIVWDPMRKSRLIESALLRLPLPAFYFDGVDARTWTVVDGLQRLSTLHEFVTKQSFALEGLEYLSSAEGKKFDQLPRGMQRDLEEAQVTLFIIRPETPPVVKFTIFYRINTGGLVLTAQEIRHALFQGTSTALLKDLAKSEAFKAATEDGVNDSRMDARECVLRFLAFRIHPYSEYSKSDLNGFLSIVMKEINSMPQEQISDLTKHFTDAMTRAKLVLGQYAFRKFDFETSKRGPVNKALFESWANVLLNFDINHLLAKRNSIRERLSNAFANDPDYGRSLSTGTGGVSAVKKRFQNASNLIQEALNDLSY